VTIISAVIIIIIIIIIIAKCNISFIHDIYTYVPEKTRISKEYIVTAILLLLFMMPISLAANLPLMYFYISTFRNMCAEPNMPVFCSSLTSWFSGMVLMYFLIIFKLFQLFKFLLVLPHFLQSTYAVFLL
jgi:hypothetical protein